jgi:hypothetical protein
MSAKMDFMIWQVDLDVKSACAIQLDLSMVLVT